MRIDDRPHLTPFLDPLLRPDKRVAIHLVPEGSFKRPRLTEHIVRALIRDNMARRSN